MEIIFIHISLYNFITCNLSSGLGGYMIKRGKPKKKLLQIKNPEVGKYRTMLSTKQKYICPICEDSLANGRVALDHDHEGYGSLRATLHMTCNSSIGRLEFGAKHMMKANHISKTDFFRYLDNTVSYLKFHYENPSHLVHPTFNMKTGKQFPKKRRKK
jgi:hypothetical protein